MTTTPTTSDIDHLPGTDRPTTGDATRPDRRRRRLRRALGAAAVTVLAAGIAGAAEVGPGSGVGSGVEALRPQPRPDHSDPFYVACMRGAASSPDALEHWVDRCTQKGAEQRLRYDDCLRGAARTADALEHWAGVCALRATAGGPTGHGGATG